MAYQINNNIIKFGGIISTVYNNKNNKYNSSVVYNNKVKCKYGKYIIIHIITHFFKL